MHSLFRPALRVLLQGLGHRSSSNFLNFQRRDSALNLAVAFFEPAGETVFDGQMSVSLPINHVFPDFFKVPFLEYSRYY